MNAGRRIRNKAQAAKGRITERLGRKTRNRRLQREGRADRASGNLKQSIDKARDAFRR
ncbi:CsbD family protein [Streptomyces lasiicapitis]|uniref:CsbD family protein n=1 Tax=Streptomyces lasiicapitis TaxID=1923961 RepID=UPI00332745E5